MSNTELSLPSKQSFQIASLFATVLVVCIHYRSAIPTGNVIEHLSWNDLVQEFLFGGVSRVAVPLFAFMAGLFYFRSDNGSLKTYAKKLWQRARTVGVPYLLTGLIAVSFWCLIRILEHETDALKIRELVSMWILRPPAEQLWFLRDLMVLVAIAPLIRRVILPRVLGRYALFALGAMWIGNIQPFPIVSGWYLLSIETLFFFSVGCLAAQDTEWTLEFERSSHRFVVGIVALWMAMVAARVWLRPHFDIWYASEHGWMDLVLHQLSIGIGCYAVLLASYRFRFPVLLKLSSASFFVYLVHEFPLRAIIQKASDRLLDGPTASWITIPVVVVGCYSAAFILARLAPRCFAVFTGGRVPEQSQTSSGPSGGFAFRWPLKQTATK